MYNHQPQNYHYYVIRSFKLRLQLNMNTWTLKKNPKIINDNKQTITPATLISNIILSFSISQTPNHSRWWNKPTGENTLKTIRQAQYMWCENVCILCRKQLYQLLESLCLRKKDSMEKKGLNNFVDNCIIWSNFYVNTYHWRQMCK